jgi:hypothetical protein
MATAEVRTAATIEGPTTWLGERPASVKKKA